MTIQPIPRVDYLKHARSLTPAEEEFIKQFEGWLPDQIIDCHAHSCLPEHAGQMDQESYDHIISTFPSFSIEESCDWQRLFHPTKTIRTLRFSGVWRGLDQKAANDYLLKHSPARDRVALYGIPENPDYTTALLHHPRVSALKMYYFHLNPPATHIYQYFTPVILEAAQDLDIPIVLHPPTDIVQCLDQIRQLVRDFPKLRICLAHISLTDRVIPGLKEAMQVLARLHQINFDTALVPDPEIVTLALNTVGTTRLMFGSDQPFHLVRWASYVHPKLGERLVTAIPYHWADPAEHRQYRHLAAKATHSHWEALTAIRQAVERLPIRHQAEAKERIFCSNAEGFYKF